MATRKIVHEIPIQDEHGTYFGMLFQYSGHAHYQGDVLHRGEPLPLPVYVTLLP